MKTAQSYRAEKDERAQRAAAARKFQAAFGKVQGAVYFAQGKTFDQAREHYLRTLSAEARVLYLAARNACGTDGAARFAASLKFSK